MLEKEVTFGFVSFKLNCYPLLILLITSLYDFNLWVLPALLGLCVVGKANSPKLSGSLKICMKTKGQPDNTC